MTEERRKVLEKIKTDLAIIKNNGGMAVSWVDNHSNIHSARCLGPDKSGDCMLIERFPGHGTIEVPLDTIYSFTILVAYNNLTFPPKSK
jgi:hypothetical protein